VTTCGISKTPVGDCGITRSYSVTNSSGTGSTVGFEAQWPDRDPVPTTLDPGPGSPQQCSNSHAVSDKCQIALTSQVGAMDALDIACTLTKPITDLALRFELYGKTTFASQPRPYMSTNRSLSRSAGAVGQSGEIPVCQPQITRFGRIPTLSR